jgi:hypothetical protein
MLWTLNGFVVGEAGRRHQAVYNSHALRSWIVTFYLFLFKGGLYKVFLNTIFLAIFVSKLKIYDIVSVWTSLS